MPKNIVVFSDGTGQDGGEKSCTNVYRLFNLVEDRTPRQVTFYDRGVGTGTRLATGLVGGRGFARNVHDCYRFIFEHYESGDHLFLIGFSRGAATVRSLAYFVHLFGILPHSRPELIPKAWAIYQINDRERREKAAREFVALHHTMWTRIRFLGCYDTVAALGLPFRLGSVLLDNLPGLRHRFHSYELSPSVEHAYHALAIDDERLTFHPVLWKPELLPHQTLRQVWFAGMHSDVGGGYREQELSNIPLVWMTRRAIDCGLHLWPPKEPLEIVENAEGLMHDSRGTRLTRLYRRRPRSWDEKTYGRPVVHESVLVRARSQKTPYAPWILELGEPEVEPWIRHDVQPLVEPTTGQPKTIPASVVQRVMGSAGDPVS
jgi:uncharacterized protein (DUF2235 family)